MYTIIYTKLSDIEFSISLSDTAMTGRHLFRGDEMTTTAD